MRIGIVADVHVGNHRVCGGIAEAGVNRRAREVAAVLRRAVEKAVDLGCKRFVIAGDLFDTSRPSPQMVRLVQEALDRRPGVPLPTFVLAGNHDIESSAEGDNALGPLKAIPSVQVVERPTAVALARGTLLLIPFQPGDAREWIPRELESLAGSLFPMPGGPGVLVTHAGIIHEDTEAFLRKAHDAIEVQNLAAACLSAKVGHAFAGNWHTGRQWSLGQTYIVQVGTLAPTGWDNPGSSGCGYGNLWIYDETSVTPRIDVVEIPGPRFHNVLHRSDVDLAALQQADGHSVYVRWKVGPDESLAESQAYLNDLVAARKLTAGIAVDDSGDVAAVARIAAECAAAGAVNVASGAGLDAILSEFVANMRIPEGVDREAVLAAARRFLAAG